MKYMVILWMLAACGAATAQNFSVALAGATCGQLQCTLREYCADSGDCEPCDGICERGHHNYDSDLCTKHCQNYLHDQHFGRRVADLEKENALLHEKLDQPNPWMIATILLICFFICVLIGLLFNKNFRSGLNDFVIEKILKKKNINTRDVELGHQNFYTGTPEMPRSRVTVTTRDQLHQGGRLPAVPPGQSQLTHPAVMAAPQAPRQELPSVPKTKTRQQEQTLDVTRLEGVNKNPGQAYLPTSCESNIGETSAGDSDVNTISHRYESSISTDSRTPSEDCVLSYSDTGNTNSSIAKDTSGNEGEISPRRYNLPTESVHGGVAKKLNSLSTNVYNK